MSQERANYGAYQNRFESVIGNLQVNVLREGVHSGDASGIVPSSFRIMRQVLDRLEDSATGRLLPHL